MAFKLENYDKRALKKTVSIGLILDESGEKCIIEEHDMKFVVSFLNILINQLRERQGELNDEIKSN